MSTLGACLGLLLACYSRTQIKRKQLCVALVQLRAEKQDEQQKEEEVEGVKVHRHASRPRRQRACLTHLALKGTRPRPPCAVFCHMCACIAT
jgi:hypothetical protein